MTPDRPDDTNDLIDRLVAAESNDALAEFRTKDFAAAVRKKMAAGPPPRKRRFAFLGAVPRPARIAGVAALIFIGVALLLLPPGKKQERLMASTIESLLLHAPGGGEVEAPGALRSPEDAPTPSPTESAIVRAILAGKESASAVAKSGPDARVPAPAKRPRPLGWEEMYKILFIDKTVERVLTLMSS